MQDATGAERLAIDANAELLVRNKTTTAAALETAQEAATAATATLTTAQEALASAETTRDNAQDLLDTKNDAYTIANNAYISATNAQTAAIRASQTANEAYLDAIGAVISVRPPYYPDQADIALDLAKARGELPEDFDTSPESAAIDSARIVKDQNKTI